MNPPMNVRFCQIMKIVLLFMKNKAILLNTACLFIYSTCSNSKSRNPWVVRE